MLSTFHSDPTDILPPRIPFACNHTQSHKVAVQRYDAVLAALKTADNALTHLDSARLSGSH